MCTKPSHGWWTQLLLCSVHKHADECLLCLLPTSWARWLRWQGSNESCSEQIEHDFMNPLLLPFQDWTCKWMCMLWPVSTHTQQAGCASSQSKFTVNMRALLTTDILCCAGRVCDLHIKPYTDPCKRLSIREQIRLFGRNNRQRRTKCSSFTEPKSNAFVV